MYCHITHWAYLTYPHLFQTKIYLLFYSDPGSGALIWQLLVAAFVGALFYLRFYIAKLKDLFSGKESAKPDELDIIEKPEPAQTTLEPNQLSSVEMKHND